jgi:GNAT superfamily N-acetyltransferase
VTPTDPVTAEVRVRRGEAEDGPAIASLYTAARVHAVPQMPPARHTAEEDVAFYSHRVAEPEVTAWLAEADGGLLGFALCTPTFLDSLYVRPDLTGQGIGSLLLDVVEATHPDGYELWVFESNDGARRLYERRGLVEVERTDGSGNEEKAPDIRMAWRPREPVSPLPPTGP